jgi:protein-tyrosine phosphatase
MTGAAHLTDPAPEPGRLIRRAVAGDAPAVVGLRDEAARWLLSRGIQQWRPGEVAVDDVLGWLATGRVYVASAGGTLVGSVRLAWEDLAVWGERPAEAGYIQALVTARGASGQGLGRQLLTHVEQVIARSGRPLARLSCLRGNAGLETFYATAGYVEVGSRTFEDQAGWEAVTLREKELS